MKEKLTRLVSTLVKISIKSKQRKIVPIVLSGLESLIIHFTKNIHLNFLTNQAT
jgi:hypothetical protein